LAIAGDAAREEKTEGEIWVTMNESGRAVKEKLRAFFTLKRLHGADGSSREIQKRPEVSCFCRAEEKATRVWNFRRIEKRKAEPEEGRGEPADPDRRRGRCTAALPGLLGTAA
jgi:hypothetical protein